MEKKTGRYLERSDKNSQFHDQQKNKNINLKLQKRSVAF
jgi:hypothetical protein